MRQNLKLKMIFKGTYINRCDKLAYIRLDSGDIVETRCIGYFKKYHWWFLITEVPGMSGYYVLTEASTGTNILREYCYDDIEEVLRDGLQTIEEKRYYFFTATKNLLVEVGQNLLLNNITDSQIGILTLWI